MDMGVPFDATGRVLIVATHHWRWWSPGFEVVGGSIRRLGFPTEDGQLA